MIEIPVLSITLLLFLLILVVVARAIIKKQSIFGRPPIPVFYFILAKLLVIVNLAFLLLKGLMIEVPRLFEPDVILNIIALGVLSIGTIILFVSTIQLNRDLIFGLPSSTGHKLHTTGVFSISRHPFYLGFLFILFSSCLFNPHIINIAAFAGAWLIHHFIMIKEEEFLRRQYGEEYEQYMKNVRRYITL
jgi:protein-S-isoprenylcysteine O-methyltransferase Ste14